MIKPTRRGRWQRVWWNAGRIANGALWVGTLAAFLFMHSINSGCHTPPPLDAITVTVLDVGTYAGTGKANPAPSAATGEVSVNYSEAPPPLTVIRTIPAKVGTVFGYRFRLEGGADTVPLTVRVTHPPIHGKTLTTYTLDVPTGATHGAFYSIDTEAEAVTGEWGIQIEHGGVVLSRERFTLE